MANKGKGKNGNGAKAETQKTEMQTAQPRGMTARGGEHPLSRLRQDIDTLFDHFFSRWPMAPDWGVPVERLWGVNVEDNDKEILVRAEAPGFEPKDFDIQVHGNVLTVRAEHKEESEEKQGEGRTWQRQYGR